MYLTFAHFAAIPPIFKSADEFKKTVSISFSLKNFFSLNIVKWVQ